MGKLTAEMKEMIDRELTFVATANGGGIVNVGPKGSTIVVDDDTLAYSEAAANKTLGNLEENPHVSVLVFDGEKKEGYQFKGTVQMVREGPIFDAISERQTRRKRSLPKLVVKIDITEIYQFKTGVPSTRVA